MRHELTIDAATYDRIKSNTQTYIIYASTSGFQKFDELTLKHKDDPNLHYLAGDISIYIHNETQYSIISLLEPDCFD